MHTYVYIHEKECSFANCGNMDDLGGIMISEISQTEKDKHCMISVICET